MISYLAQHMKSLFQGSSPVSMNQGRDGENEKPRVDFSWLPRLQLDEAFVFLPPLLVWVMATHVLAFFTVVSQFVMDFNIILDISLGVCMVHFRPDRWTKLYLAEHLVLAVPWQMSLLGWPAVWDWVFAIRFSTQPHHVILFYGATLFEIAVQVRFLRAMFFSPPTRDGDDKLPIC